MSHFIYVRQTGHTGTYVVEMPMESAVNELRIRRGSGLQIGILGGADFSMIKRVYGEFAPFYKVKTVAEAVSRTMSNAI